MSNFKVFSNPFVNQFEEQQEEDRNSKPMQNNRHDPFSFNPNAPGASSSGQRKTVQGFEPGRPPVVQERYSYQDTSNRFTFAEDRPPNGSFNPNSMLHPQQFSNSNQQLKYNDNYGSNPYKQNQQPPVNVVGGNPSFSQNQVYGNPSPMYSFNPNQQNDMYQPQNSYGGIPPVTQKNVMDRFQSIGLVHSDSRPPSQLKRNSGGHKRELQPQDLENILDQMSIFGESMMNETQKSHIQQQPQQYMNPFGIDNSYSHIDINKNAQPHHNPMTNHETHNMNYNPNPENYYPKGNLNTNNNNNNNNVYNNYNVTSPKYQGYDYVPKNSTEHNLVVGANKNVNSTNKILDALQENHKSDQELEDAYQAVENEQFYQEMFNIKNRVLGILETYKSSDEDPSKQISMKQIKKNVKKETLDISRNYGQIIEKYSNHVSQIDISHDTALTNQSSFICRGNTKQDQEVNMMMNLVQEFLNQFDTSSFHEQQEENNKYSAKPEIQPSEVYAPLGSVKQDQPREQQDFYSNNEVSPYKNNNNNNNNYQYGYNDEYNYSPGTGNYNNDYNPNKSQFNNHTNQELFVGSTSYNLPPHQPYIPSSNNIADKFMADLDQQIELFGTQNGVFGESPERIKDAGYPSVNQQRISNGTSQIPFNNSVGNNNNNYYNSYNNYNLGNNPSSNNYANNNNNNFNNNNNNNFNNADSNTLPQFQEVNKLFQKPKPEVSNDEKYDKYDTQNYQMDYTQQTPELYNEQRKDPFYETFNNLYDPKQNNSFEQNSNQQQPQPPSYGLQVEPSGGYLAPTPLSSNNHHNNSNHSGENLQNSGDINASIERKLFETHIGEILVQELPPRPSDISFYNTEDLDTLLAKLDYKIEKIKDGLTAIMNKTNLPLTQRILMELINQMSDVLKSKDSKIIKKTLTQLEKSVGALKVDASSSFSMYNYLSKIKEILEEQDTALQQSVMLNDITMISQRGGGNSQAIQQNEPPNYYKHIYAAPILIEQPVQQKAISPGDRRRSEYDQSTSMKNNFGGNNQPQGSLSNQFQSPPGKPNFSNMPRTPSTDVINTGNQYTLNANSKQEINFPTQSNQKPPLSTDFAQKPVPTMDPQILQSFERTNSSSQFGNTANFNYSSNDNSGLTGQNSVESTNNGVGGGGFAFGSFEKDQQPQRGTVDSKTFMREKNIGNNDVQTVSNPSTGRSTTSTNVNPYNTFNLEHRRQFFDMAMEIKNTLPQSHPGKSMLVSQIYDQVLNKKIADEDWKNFLKFKFKI